MSTRRLPDALLERHLAGALTGETLARVEKTLEESEPDRARLAALRANSAAYLMQHPAGPFVAAWEKKTAPRRTGWWLALLLGPAVAAAGVLIALQSPDEPEFSVKGGDGGITLGLWRRVGNTAKKWEPGTPLAPGEALRFELRAPGSGYVALLSRDAVGAVTVYFPYGAENAGPFDARARLLPEAIELDAVPGLETIWALWSADPFPLDWAKKALAQGRTLEEAAPAGLQVTSVQFEKQ